MNTAISDDGGLSKHLRQIPHVHGITLRRPPGEPATVNATFASPTRGEKTTVPESTIELEYGSVSNYEIHVGVYSPDTAYPLSTLRIALRSITDRHDLFPNGSYEIHIISEGKENGATVEFTPSILFSRYRKTRPVEDVLRDIKTLLELRDMLQ